MSLILQKQAFRHRPADGIYGDCHRTAYAMVLGLPRDDVPHVFANGSTPEQANNHMLEWLSGRGLTEVAFPVQGDKLEAVLDCYAVYAKGVPFILGGTSGNDTNHSVAVLDGAIFDPAIDESGIKGPCSDGYYWITFLVPKMKELRLPRAATVSDAATGEGV